MSQDEIKKIIREPAYLKTPKFWELSAELALEDAACMMQISEADRLRYLHGKEYKSVKDLDKMSPGIDGGSKQGRIMENEKDFLKKASFTTHANLDQIAKDHVKSMPFLKGVSTNPRHLTILSAELAQKTANILYTHFSASNTQKRLFVEINPGVCRVSQALLNEFEQNEDTQKKLLLFNSQKRYDNACGKLISEYRDQLEILPYDLYRSRQKFKPRERKAINYFLSKHTAYTQTLPPVIYGIFPWHEPLIAILFSNYLFETGFFNLFATKTNQNQLPEFLIYLSAWEMAKINPNNDSKYFPLNNKWSIMCRLFCESEILAEESVEKFYPYPQLSGKDGVRTRMIDFKKMYLVKLKFKVPGVDGEKPELEGLIENKVIFVTFLRHLFVRPQIILRKSLKFATVDVETLFREANRLGGCVKGGYGPVREYKAEQFYYIFKAMMNRPDLVRGRQSLASLLETIVFEEDDVKERFSLSDLKSMNRQFSGQLMVPEAMDKEEEKEWENEFFVD